MQKLLLKISVLFLWIGMIASAGCSGKEKEFEELVLEEDICVKEGEADSGEKNAGEPGAEKEPVQFVVHVCGAVRTPGVYELLEGSRIFDAVNAAGGMTEEASADYLNQATEVVDGQQIYVPTKEEMAAGTVPAGETASGKASKPIQDGTGTDSTKVNLNQASKEELMTLTGIGEAKADSIIRYREEQGGFKTIEELMTIEGIKEGVFQKIKDDITVT